MLRINGKTRTLFVSLCILLSSMATQASSFEERLNIKKKINEISPKVLYGLDSRVESRLYSSKKFRDKSQSVAVRIERETLTPKNFFDILSSEETITSEPNTMKSLVPNMCDSERFIDQKIQSPCTGFLIAKNTLLTAGHCMEGANACEDFAWSFSFDDRTQSFQRKDVFTCKSIIASKMIYEDDKILDYAIIELNEDTSHIKPLSLRKLGRPIIGTPLVAIGHPMGLPKKTIDGSKISILKNENDLDTKTFLKMRRYILKSDLDTYGGNSGSPVFNKLTGFVEGIVIQGHEDYTFDEIHQCEKSIKLKAGIREGKEVILRINMIPELKLLKL